MRTWPHAMLLLVLGGAHAALAQAPAEPPQAIDCAMFPKSTDEAALVKRFGRENVVNAKLDGAEGEVIQGTVLYPKDQKRRLEIYWSDTAKRRGLSSVAVKNASEWSVRTPSSARPAVGLGTGLDAMEEANERPFLLNGFGWDMGGYGSDWKGGKLANMAGGCFFTARFDPDPKAKEKALDKVSGDRQFGSSDPAMRAVKPFLSSMTLDWPE